MKTLTELRNKKVRVQKTLTYPNIDYLIERFIKRLQPEDYLQKEPYKIINDIKVKIENKTITFSCDKLFYISVGNNRVNEPTKYFQGSKYSSLKFVKYFEKINRSLFEIKNFSITLPYPTIKKEIKYGYLTFRSKDYYFQEDNSNSKSYGEILSLNHLITDKNRNIIGIKIETFSKDTIIYNFI